MKNFDIAYDCFLKSQANPKYKDCDPKVFQNYIHLYRENIDFKKFSGDSLKEILRLSEANEHLWHEIFSDNKENLEYIKEKLKKKLL